MLMGTAIVRNVMEQRFAGTVQMLCSRPRRAGHQVERAVLGLESPALTFKWDPTPQWQLSEAYIGSRLPQGSRWQMIRLRYVRQTGEAALSNSTGEPTTISMTIGRISGERAQAARHRRLACGLDGKLS